MGHHDKATLADTAWPHPITRADLDWWLARADELHWTFASSMAGVPHSYVVRGKQLKDPEFIRAVKTIRVFGRPGKFWEYTNIYLTVGERKWWTMGDTLDGTVIINTATTEKTYGRQDAPNTHSGVISMYDGLAPDYDAMYLKDTDILENETIAKLIRQHFGAYAPRTLDVGCGTGLLLDLGTTAPGMFTGIDPSQGMLNELIRKHPRVRDIQPALAEDVIDQYHPRSYELVTSLFGSASHLTAHTIERMSEICSNLMVIMTYIPPYIPDYYGGVYPDEYDESREAAIALEEMGARSFQLNKFRVTVVGG